MVFCDALSEIPTCMGSHLVYKWCTVILSHTFLLVLWKKNCILHTFSTSAWSKWRYHRQMGTCILSYGAHSMRRFPFPRHFHVRNKICLWAVYHIWLKSGGRRLKENLVFRNCFYIYLFTGYDTLNPSCFLLAEAMRSTVSFRQACLKLGVFVMQCSFFLSLCYSCYLLVAHGVFVSFHWDTFPWWAPVEIFKIMNTQHTLVNWYSFFFNVIFVFRLALFFFCVKCL